MRGAIAAAMLCAAGAAAAQDTPPPTGRRAESPERPDWGFALTAYPTTPRGGDSTTCDADLSVPLATSKLSTVACIQLDE